MQPQLSAGDGGVTLAQPMATRGTPLVFTQTLPGSGQLPIEVDSANLDPFTGDLAQALPLPTGTLRVATYDAKAALSFSDVTPEEGAGGYSVRALGTAYDTPGAAAAVAVTPGGTSRAAPNEPVLREGLGSGTLTVALAGTGAHSYDSAELVVSDTHGIVATQDISALIGTANAQATITLPAGSAAAALGGTAVYAIGVRSWQRAAPGSSVQWARSGTAIDMRTNTTASASITLP
jgi:hypothetical protein